jgi:Uncharacterized protein conserved in bacteria
MNENGNMSSPTVLYVLDRFLTQGFENGYGLMSSMGPGFSCEMVLLQMSKNNMVFTLFISFVILLRIGELILSKRNEKWLLQNGAIEYGQKHYPLIVALHVFFIVSLIIEYSMKRTVSCSSFLLVLYFLLLVFKAWIILSLGKFWNTKIYRIPNYPLIKKGLYRYFKHPNYMIVIIEIAVYL